MMGGSNPACLFYLGKESEGGKEGGREGGREGWRTWLAAKAKMRALSLKSSSLREARATPPMMGNRDRYLGREGGREGGGEGVR